MARTKKYLSSPRTSSSKRGFYRPLKRVSSDTTSPSASLHQAPKSEPSNDEITQLREQIEQAQQLKQELDSKIKKEIEGSSQKAYQQLDDIISQANTKLTQYEHSQTPNLPPREEAKEEVMSEPASSAGLDFNSHGLDEKISLLEKELHNSLRKENQLKKEVTELRQNLENEHEKMSDSIKSVKKDVARTQPISENKFFTISKELQGVVTAMNHLVEDEDINPQAATNPPANPNQPAQPGQPQPNPAAPADQANQNPPTQQPDQNQNQGQNPPAPTNSPVSADGSSQNNQAEANPPPQPTEGQPQPQNQQQPVPADQAPAQPGQEGQSQDQPAKKGLLAKIPKPVKLIAMTLVIVMALGGGAYFFFFSRSTEVDTALVQEYLPEDAAQAPPQPQVAGDKTEAGQEDEQIKDNKEETSPKSDEKTEAPRDKYDEAQADVDFSDTKWDTYSDPQFGIELNFPKNSVNVVRTDSSVTFLRKTGYVFKVQMIETALEVKEYWKLIKASSLNYKVKETTFREKEALFLELEDFSDYPGDKYLVKHGEYIYDVWYATYSNTLSDDDAKRIDIMINSLKFL